VTRELVSGRDFQLRYALWRALHLALGDDALAGEAARMRLEWPIAAGRTRKLFVDVLLEDSGGQPLEIIECKEHEAFLRRESLASFARDVRSLMRVVPLTTRFRFATNARFVREGSKVFDFAIAEQRREVASRVDDVLLDDDRIRWEIALPAKSLLTAEAIFHLANALPDPRGIYARLYARLAAQMAQRLAWDGNTLREVVSDVQRYVFGKPPKHVATPGFEETFSLHELRLLMARPARRGEQIAVADLWCALRRDLFGETNVTLEQIFVDPEAHLEDEETGSAMAMLFRWLTGQREDASNRIPLLVLGPFGSGKSSLLTSFGVRLAEATDVVPLLVPLRDVITAGQGRSLRDEVVRYVRDQWGIDLESPQPGLHYCLLCDGFDELNLYYMAIDQEEWVRQALRDLASLATRKEIAVVISSRPILLMSDRLDVACRFLTIEPFDDERIRIWCSKYRAAAGLASEFSWSFLEERNLAEVAETPIVLYMLARIYETAPELLRRKRYTRAEVYKIFIDWTSRTGGYIRDARKHRVPRNYREILQEIAWAMLESGEGIVDQDVVLARLQKQFGVKVDRIPIDENLLVAHMLRPAGAASGGRRLIEFSHQSFREYLVAEKIWTFLGPARGTGRLSSDTNAILGWLALAQAEIDFLGDMIAAVPPAEAARLANAIMSMEESDLLQSDVAAILAIKAARQGGREAGPALEQLRIILTGLLAPGLRGFLLKNLRRLCIDLVDMEGAALSEANLANVDLRKWQLSRASFASATFTNSRFRSCDFTQSLFRPRLADETRWEDCDFRAATIAVPADFIRGALVPPPAERLRFLGCRFDRAKIERLHLRQSKLTGCTWTGAEIADVMLEDCEIDRATHDLLLASGARLTKCRIV
jgi:uncharacterized protein YjbI with pentapeptide repeats